MTLPPTLDRSWPGNPASSGGWLAGFTGRRMKLLRRFPADRAVRAHIVIVSTPSLAFSPRLVDALSFSSAIPDSSAIPHIDHFHGRGGRVYPLWFDAEATQPNLRVEIFVALEPRQADLTERICAAPLVEIEARREGEATS